MLCPSCLYRYPAPFIVLKRNPDPGYSSAKCVPWSLSPEVPAHVGKLHRDEQRAQCRRVNEVRNTRRWGRVVQGARRPSERGFTRHAYASNSLYGMRCVACGQIRARARAQRFLRALRVLPRVLKSCRRRRRRRRRCRRCRRRCHHLRQGSRAANVLFIT